MEPCVGAHHLGRRAVVLGHDVRLMTAKFVRPFCRKQKNDFNDAQAIAETVTRPTSDTWRSKRQHSSICRRCTACASA
jgi:transposase